MGQVLIGVEQVTCLMARCNAYEKLYLGGPLRTLIQTRPHGPSRTHGPPSYQDFFFVAFYLQSLDKRTVVKAVTSVIIQELADLLEDLGRWEFRIEAEVNVCEKRLNHATRNRHDANFHSVRDLLRQQIEASNANTIRLWKRLDDDEPCKMLQWISEIPHETDNCNARRDRVEGTGDWLLAHQTFASRRDALSSAPQPLRTWRRRQQRSRLLLLRSKQGGTPRPGSGSSSPGQTNVSPPKRIHDRLVH